MSLLSAGLVMCRRHEGTVEFFLVHPGGPFYVKKNEGVWSIPKGTPEGDEELLTTAQREFQEETGLIPHEPFHFLGTTKTKGGKTIHAWAFEGAWDASTGIICNTFPLEWPPKSGKIIQVPENDRAEWMSFYVASRMINPAQIVLLERALEIYR